MKIFQWRPLCGALLAMALTASIAAAADLPPLPEGLAVPKSATKMPAFNLPTAIGSTVRSDDYKGKIIIARFWASW